jgi:hypothetical protein
MASSAKVLPHIVHRVVISHQEPAQSPMPPYFQPHVVAQVAKGKRQGREHVIALAVIAFALVQGKEEGEDEGGIV